MSLHAALLIHSFGVMTFWMAFRLYGNVSHSMASDLRWLLGYIVILYLISVGIDLLLLAGMCPWTGFCEFSLLRSLLFIGGAFIVISRRLFALTRNGRY